MRLLIFVVITYVFVSCMGCKEDPPGPEMNCHLNDLYVQDDHFLKAGKVFDLRADPPKEIKNGSIEYKTAYQWLIHSQDIPVPYPYTEYFIDSIVFLNPSEVEVHIFESENSKVYTYARNDCGVDLHSTDGDLHLELTHSGNEMTEQRFAIYDHRSKGVNIDSQYFKLDTFSFLEFRLGAFASYEEIIQQFAHDHPGQYDTVAVELVQNKTRE
jgi:hypothetical protein